MPRAVACRRAGRSVPSCLSSSSNSCRRTYTGRSPDGNGSGSCGSIHLACQSAGSSSPVSNEAGSDHDDAPDVVQIRTRHVIASCDRNGSNGHGTSTWCGDSNRAVRPSPSSTSYSRCSIAPGGSHHDRRGLVSWIPSANPSKCSTRNRWGRFISSAPSGRHYSPSTITCTLVQNLLRSGFLLALSGDGEVCVLCTSGRRGATASRGGLQ